MFKKKLIVLAVAGAVNAPGLVMAQATNVQIYGILNMRVDSFRFSANSANTIAPLTKQHVGTDGPARIGFRGTEDLGGGMQAFFQVESQVSLDARSVASSDASGGNLWGGRPSYVGLRGNSWGEVSAGFQDSSYKNVMNIWNAVSSLSHTQIIMGNGNTNGTIPSPNCQGVLNQGTGAITPVGTAVCLPAIEGNGTSFARTVSNSLKYTSPSLAGVRISGIWEAMEYKEPTTSTNAIGNTNQYKGGLWATSVTWAGGPWSVGGAWEQHRGAQSTNTAFTDRDAKDTGWTLGGKWDFGPGVVGAGVEKLKYGNTGVNNVAGTANDYSLVNWVVNGTWRITQAGSIDAGFSKTRGRRDCGAGINTTAAQQSGPTATCGNDTGAKMYSISYNHSLSKRTQLYASYGKIDNNAAATYYYVAGPTTNSRNGSTGGLAGGVDVSNVQVGVRHSF